MKKLFLIPLILFSLISLPSLSESMDDLVKRDGLYFIKNSDDLFTGKIKEFYNTDEIRITGEIINGKLEGTWLEYHKRGFLYKKIKLKNGIKDGPWFQGFFRRRDEPSSGMLARGAIKIP